MMFEKLTKDDITIVSVNLKKATLENTEKFREYLGKVIEDGTKKIIIDLSVCDFVDSTFLGTLVICLKAIDITGAKLKLVCNEKVAFIICEITRLSSVFKVHNYLEEAIEEFTAA